MTTHLIIGAGEVGTALDRAMGGNADLRDIDLDYDLQDAYDVLHICYRWSDGFVGTTKMYAEQYSADLVVVHSTVPVGTCDPEGWVHSPVRGRHPDLLGGVVSFSKHFGGPRAYEASRIVELWGGTAVLHAQAATTEAAKLWELTLFGWEVVMMKAVADYCTEHGLSFDEVYTEFSTTYNEGYETLGFQGFRKPILRYTPGPIGGHCVIAGAEMLEAELAADLVAKNKGFE